MTSTSLADWRFDNLRRLQGAAFRLTNYKAPTPEWNHDHCEGCFATFANFEGPKILHRGYVNAEPHKETPEPELITQCKEQGTHCVPAPIVNGCSLHWVCPTCFDDFRETLGFRLES